MKKNIFDYHKTFMDVVEDKLKENEKKLSEDIIGLDAIIDYNPIEVTEFEHDKRRYEFYSFKETDKKLNENVVDLEPITGIKGYCPKKEFELMKEFAKEQGKRDADFLWYGEYKGTDIKDKDDLMKDEDTETDKSNNLEYYKEKTMNEIRHKHYQKFKIK